MKKLSELRFALGLLCLSGGALQASTYLINIQANNSQWVCADGGGGGSGDVIANRNSAGGWETFILDDTNGGSLQNGDTVTLRARDTGLYLCAESGGGGDLVANRIYGGSWETFTIYKVSGSGTITTGDQVGFQVNNGQYICAESGGGGQVVANRSVLGSWETFTLAVGSAPSPLWTTPSYTPGYWNDGSTVQSYNNCYNYANNRRTDTFAQVGRAAGHIYTSLTGTALYNAALFDGLEPTTSSATAPEGKTKLAIVVWPSTDFHCYRQDSNGLWTHKPGSTTATNLDNSGNSISSPETANRGNYSVFVGYFFTPSDSAQGGGHANIN